MCGLAFLAGTYAGRIPVAASLGDWSAANEARAGAESLLEKAERASALTVAG
ncbi:hypothetical protein [Microtetraspora malaysiensis]|uniref:hypothetical protein n=1 Tax=Microtetraspora malaysiensis TaxID=161358 RepID=UPI003D8B6CCD